MKPRVCIFLLSASLGACTSPSVLKAPLPAQPGVRTPEFQQAAGGILGGAFLPGNRIATFNNGDQIFPAMLGAIRGAKRSITFETFVFEKGEVPRQFAEALSERARAGVKVHVILDAHGAKKSRTYDAQMEAAGVQIERFHPILWPDLRRYNNRTHRKLLVVDGKIGFIGGVGIADEWAGHADSPEHWRDLHYQIQGPMVLQLQGAFSHGWQETRKTLLTGADYFPALPAAGPSTAGAFSSSPRNGRYAVSLLYHLAIASAKHSLRIENAYFVPDSQLIDALAGAARRGVRVQIILPGEHIDQKAVRRASRKRWAKLMEAGVEIYEFKPTMIHTKLLIVDDFFVSAGSANFDLRSLALNDEANFNVLDGAFASEQIRIFEADRLRSERMTPAKLQKNRLFSAPLEVLQTPLEGQL